MLSISNLLVPFKYDISIVIDTNSSDYKTDLLIYLKLQNNSSNEIVFHCNDNLKIIGDKLELNNQKIDFTHKDGLLTIKSDSLKDIINTDNEDFTATQMDTTLAKNNILKLSYHNNFNEENTNGIFKLIQNNQSIISTHFQPSFARNALPCIDEPSLKNIFSLKIKTNTTNQVISCSAVKETILDNKNKNWKTVYFNDTILLPISLFGFTVGPLSNINLNTKLINNIELPINIWSLNDKNDINDMTYALDVIQKYLPIIENWFNFKFPINKLDIIALPKLDDFVMENFTMINVQKNLLLTPAHVLANNSFRLQVVKMLVHLLIHHWIGNFITFDSWEHLWFNESFATWLADYLIDQVENDKNSSNNFYTNDEYINNNLIKNIKNDALIDNANSITDLQKQKLKLNGKNTNDLFDISCYERGIILLRSLQLTIGNELLSKSFNNLLLDTENFHKKSVKPIDIWSFISKDLKSENVINFYSSWTRLTGLPIVKLTKDEKNTILTQNRFFSYENDEDAMKQITNDNFEDIPYHIPLLIKLQDSNNDPSKTDMELMDKENVLMTDRSLKLSLDYPIALINNDAQGYYIVTYEHETFYDNFVNDINSNKISDINLFKIFFDLSLIIGNKLYQKKVHVKGFLKIMNALASLPKDINLGDLKIWRSLREALQIMETLIEFAELTMNKSLKNQLITICMKICMKIDWSVETYDMMSNDEVWCLSTLLDICHQSNIIANKLEEWFKNIKDNESKIYIPSDFILPICKHMVMLAETYKELKIVMDLQKDKNLKNIVKHCQFSNPYLNDDQCNEIIKMQIMQSLGYTLQPSLIEKLNVYFNSNIREPHIEQIFIGLCYHGKHSMTSKESIFDMMWSEYERHHRTWEQKLNIESMELIKLQLSRIVKFQDMQDCHDLPVDAITQQLCGLKENIDLLQDCLQFY